MPSASDVSSTRHHAVQRVLLGILLANIAVVIVKVVIGAKTRSLAVLGDGIQSSVDGLNNLLGLAFVRVAAKGPDPEHPYGHAKFETLGALAIVVFLSVSTFEVVRGAIERLLTGARPPAVTTTDLAVLALTLVLNLVVVTVETRQGRRLQSELLLADALHTRTDVFVTLAVLAGLALARAGIVWADPVLAIAVSGVAAWAGYEIVRRALPALVDERALEADTIRLAAEGVGGVRAAYAIRSRSAGPRSFAELTIAVDAAIDVAAAHRIADAVETRLRDRLRLDEVLVHVEPA
ncbi:MAG TPA: cation diffusion facilitator family transporter [Gemmatimonadales bacterium]|nr:cation diffusion facilitator family transporter [Gemmatimonadales bacterium]